MYLSICSQSGLIYEGLSAAEVPSVPTPSVTQAKLIQNETDWCALPKGLSNDPIHWVFREDSFDPVARTRRGRLFEPQPGQSQPGEQRVGPHPYEDPSMRQAGPDWRFTKRLYSFSACHPLLGMPRQGQGMTLALGDTRASSAWRIIQTEVLTNGSVMVTLKALSAFGILPDVDYRRIEERFRPAVKEAIERVLDSAFRETPISVVDQCRAALTVLLSRWLVQSDHGTEETLRLDLGKLVSLTEKQSKDCAANAAHIVARLHPRGKPNERLTRDLRLPDSGDAEFALHAVGLVLREFNWAT